MEGLPVDMNEDDVRHLLAPKIHSFLLPVEHQTHPSDLIRKMSSIVIT